MAERVIMPKQGLQMTEGTIIKWLKKEGETCAQGEPLFEMETDKLTITMDSPAGGKLLKIIRGEGETVPITELIAVIGEEGEEIAGAAGNMDQNKKEEKTVLEPVQTQALVHAGSMQAAAKDAAKFTTPRARMRAHEGEIDILKVQGTGPDALVIERDVLAFKQEAVHATPLAKKIAQIENVEIDSLSGSGPHGKIMRQDIMAAADARNAKYFGARGERIVPMSGMRKVIAQRMTNSLREHAQLTHTVRVDMTNAAAMRESYKKAEKRISFNDIILLATSRALKDFPIMNAALTERGIVMRDYVNLGVAVAVENGLVVPNLKDADLMRLEEIAMMAKELAGKAKENKLTQEETSNGTFTVSNLGMFGLDTFTAIINSPESGILAIGAIAKTPVVVEDEIVIRPIMSMTLTYDHRIVDGAPAAEFLRRVKQYVETPTLML